MVELLIVRRMKPSAGVTVLSEVAKNSPNNNCYKSLVRRGLMV